MHKTKNLYLVWFLAIIFKIDLVKSEDNIINPNRNFLKVVDGDTIHIMGKRYRLHGIDAPEATQKCERNDKIYFCGTEATEHLKSLIKNEKKVWCKKKAVDRYKRIVAVCYYNKKNLNKLMVRNGWAIAYQKYSKDYVDDENYARKNKLGMWEGRFIEPYKWREKNR